MEYHVYGHGENIVSCLRKWLMVQNDDITQIQSETCTLNERGEREREKGEREKAIEIGRERVREKIDSDK